MKRRKLREPADRTSQPGQQMRAVKALALQVALMTALPGFAGEPPAGQLPTGERVVAGQAEVSRAGASMTITQTTPRAAIDWTGFDVGGQAQVRFAQPEGGAILNRVDSGQPSRIFGRITANGQVFLTNPAGIHFGPTASVDVGALIATTHRIGLEDFLAGRYRFDRLGATGTVLNEGTLKAAIGGYIALLAPEVRNHGVILAQMGTVALAAGEAFELKLDAKQSVLGLRVEPATIRALVENRHLVLAPGGLVILSAMALDTVRGAVVRNEGRIVAQGLAQRGGRILLEAGEQVENRGSIDANASAQGPAGEVTLSAPSISTSGTIVVNGSAEYPEGGRLRIVAQQFMQAAGGTLSASGPSRGGSVAIEAAQTAVIHGRIDASARPVADGDAKTVAASAPVGHADDPATAPAAIGGTVTIAANAAWLEDASIEASGLRGGLIRLEAFALAGGPAMRPAPGEPAPPLPAPLPSPGPRPDPGHVILGGATTLSTRGRRHGGGEVLVLGDGIELRDAVTIDASGATRGGSVRIGGGWQGGEDLPQATRTVLGRDARIDASARDRGDGGSIVLWSATANPASITVIDGALRADGGAAGGNGGRIETSGHRVELGRATVSAGSSLGQGRLWLVDPYDYLIDATVAATIATALDTGTSVTIDALTGSGPGAGASSSAAGNITVAADISKSAGGRATLTLKATGNIVLDPGVALASTADPLDVVLWADSDGNRSGAVRLIGTSGAPIAIDTQGGHLWIGGGSGTTTWNGLTVGDDSAYGNAFERRGINLEYASLSTVGANGAGDIRLSGASRYTSGDYAIGVRMIANASISGGDVSVSGSGAPNASDNAFNWGISIQAGSTITGRTRVGINGTGGGTSSSGGDNYGVLVDGAGSAIRALGDADLLVNATGGGAGSSTRNRGLYMASGGAIAAERGKLTITATRGAGNSFDVLLNGASLGAAGTTGDITIAADHFERQSSNTLTTAGHLTVRPVSDSFPQAFTWSGLTLGTTLGSLTLGKPGNAADVTISDPVTVNGPLTVHGNRITLSADASTRGSTASVLLRARGDIVQDAGVSVSTAGGPAVYWADADGNRSGVVRLIGTSGARVGIDTQGGHLWIGGGSGTTTWNGLTVGDDSAYGNAFERRGINLEYATLTTVGTGSAGDIVLQGASRYTSGDYASGIRMAGGAIVTGGNVSVTGTGSPNASGNNRNWGVSLEGAATINGSVQVTVSGSGGGSSSSGGDNYGVYVSDPGSAIRATGDADLLVSATGGGAGSSTSNRGLYMASGGAIAAERGKLTITATRGAGNSFDVLLNGASLGAAGTTGDITIAADRFERQSSNTLTTAGHLTVRPVSDSFPLAFTWSGLTLGATLGGLTLGKPGNAADVTISDPVTVNGPLTVHGNRITLSADVSSLGSASGVRLQARGNIEQAAGVSVSTAGGSVVYWADSDGNQDGAVRLMGIPTARVGIDTQGGHLWIGGGSGSTTWNGLTVGDGAAWGSTVLEGFNLDFGNLSTLGPSGAGGLRLVGASRATGANYAIGVRLFTGASVIGGDVSITGTGSPNGGSNNNSWGVSLENGASITGHARVDVDGTGGGGSSTGGANFGVQIAGTGSAILATGDAELIVRATGGGAGASPNNRGLNMGPGSVIAAERGPLTITARRGIGNAPDLQINGAALGAAGTTGDITLETDRLERLSSNTLTTTGHLTIRPVSDSFSQAFSWSGFTLGDTLGGLTLGKSGNLADLTIADPVSVAGPVAIRAGSVAVDRALAATGPGDLLIEAGGSLSIANGAGISTSAGNITVSANRFVNQAGAQGIAATGGDWRVWSGNPSPFSGATPDVPGGLPFDFKQYAATYGSSTPLGTGNGLLHAFAPQVAASLVGTVSRPYDGGTSVTLETANHATSGAVDGDIVSLAGALTGTYVTAGTGSAPKDAGTGKTVSVTGFTLAAVSSEATGSKPVYGYSASSASASGAIGAITPRVLAVTGSRVYDGSRVIAGSDLTATNLVGTETVSITGEATMGSAAVATGIQSVPTDGLGLADGTNGGRAANYTLTGASVSAWVTPRAMTVSGITAADRVYDGSTAATVSTAGAVLSGLVAGDAVSVSATGVFDDRNAGTGKTVRLTSAYAGADVGNYAITDQATTTATITPKALTVSGITAADRVYDGSTAATVSTAAAVLSGLVTGDAVSVSATGVFDDRNAGTGKTVRLTSTYAGADRANYTITGQTTTSATITPKALTVAGITAADRVYDGSTVATVSTVGAVLSGLVTGDAVSVSATGVFDDRNAGTGKTVRLASAYAGADRANYAITDQATTTATISPRTVRLSATKTDDGTTALGASVRIETGIPGEGLNYANALARFGDAIAKDNHVASITLLDGPGGLAANYRLPALTPSEAPVTILPRPPMIVPPTVPVPLQSPVAAVETRPAGTSARPATSSAEAEPAPSPDRRAETGSSDDGTDNAAPKSTAEASDGAGESGSGTQVATRSADPVSTAANSATAIQPMASRMQAPGTTPTASAQASTTPPTSPAPALATARPDSASVASSPVRPSPSASGATASRAAEPASGATPTPASVMQGAPAAVTLSATLGASGNAASGIDGMTSARVEAAQRSGVAPAQAARAGAAFETVLTVQMSRGAPAAQAIARAEQAFSAEAGVPAPKTPADQAARGLAAGGESASSLGSMAGAKTAQGAAAFEAALGRALAAGADMTTALAKARAATSETEAASRADATPVAALTGASAAPAPRPASIERAIGSLLARGLPPAQALLRAERMAALEARAARVDATRPANQLAAGRLPALGPQGNEGALSRFLGAALSSGRSLEDVLARAREIARFEQEAREAEARDPASPLVRDGVAPPRLEPDVERAFGAALRRGLDAGEALERARRAAGQAVPAPSPASALASGQSLETLLPAEVAGPVYGRVLGQALARGVPPDRAIELARKAEDESAFRFPIPRELAVRLSAASARARFSTAEGAPLPDWIRFDSARQTFVAREIPAGGLPLEVRASVEGAAGPGFRITISDGPPPPVPSANGRARTPQANLPSR
ncbi:MAG: hypothetical protein RIS35_982 [Pseudomonadota bacterium]